ncbi:MAG: glycosyltransferase [Acidimicrobiales bacterium]
MSALVDVVVLTWNDGDRLAVAVGSALGSVGVDVNVVVVDNGSDPPAVVAEDPRVRLLRNEANRGVAAGRNQGTAAGHASFVVLLDSDARLHPGGLAALLEPLTADDGIALAVPTFSGQAPEASAGRAPTAARKVARGLNLCSDYAPVPRRPGDRWWDVEFGIGACQLFRRSAWESVGGIDEGYFYGPEDVDFCLRVLTTGRVVQVAGQVCDHPARRRFRRVLTRRGLDHAGAIARYLWRTRRHARIPRPAAS